MSEVLVKAEKVSKKFCKTLKHSMYYGLQDIAKNLVGISAISEDLRPGEFWSLSDVSFELRRGECLGLIGPNGAGKSTLLKLLNGILTPDAGRIEMRGRIAALIELGAGFHPQLTGRENIYINGAILGLGKGEIDRKLEAIIEFSELGDFIDTPVKFYSSGMYVRLGFAVASQVEPDVLLIDEVLAVGDAGFRAKCYNRIAELLEKCAVVIISHDMSMVARIASKVTVLSKGELSFFGETKKAIQLYLETFRIQQSRTIENGVRLTNFKLTAGWKGGDYLITACDSIEMILTLEAKRDEFNVNLRLCVLTISGDFCAEWNNLVNGDLINLTAGIQTFVINLHNICLNSGIYFISLVVNGSNNLRHLLWIDRGWVLRVNGEITGNAPYEIRGSARKL